MLLDARASFLNTFVLKAGDTMTGDLTFSGAFHPVFSPGSDTDHVWLESDVTGTPTLSWDEANSFIGLNSHLRVSSDSYGALWATLYKTSADPAQVVLQKGRGTEASPAAASANDLLFQLLGRGYGATGFQSAGEVTMKARGNFTDSSAPAHIEFKTTPGGAVSSTRRMCVRHDGKINVGTSEADLGAWFSIDQESTTGAMPVLLLDQADIDLEFIKFIGSSEDSQADRSLVDAADMTTPGALTGWIQIYVEDIQSTNPITDGVYYIPFYAAPSA
jgi:hypothetical protein